MDSRPGFSREVSSSRAASVRALNPTQAVTTVGWLPDDRLQEFDPRLA